MEYSAWLSPSAFAAGGAMFSISRTGRQQSLAASGEAENLKN